MISDCFIGNMFHNINHLALHSLILQAFESSDLDMDIAAAVKWGEGFTFPPRCFTSDLDDLDAFYGDLGALIRKR